MYLFLGGKYVRKNFIYNNRAILHGKEAYMKALVLYTGVNDGNNREAIEAVRSVMEHLRNESDFGYGSDEVIASENKIHGYLMDIENNIHRMEFEEIIKNCKKIHSELKIRMELKKL
mgnify:FL=1